MTSWKQLTKLNFILLWVIIFSYLIHNGLSNEIKKKEATEDRL